MSTPSQAIEDIDKVVTHCVRKDYCFNAYAAEIVTAIKEGKVRGVVFIEDKDKNLAQEVARLRSEKAAWSLKRYPLES